ncbi:MAG: hypothetical protein ACYC26_04410 [Phycisphaerales bacterium]
MIARVKPTNTRSNRMETTVTVKNKLTLTQAGRKVGKSPSAVFRWMRDGICGERLQTAYFGGSLATSEDALNDFARRVADAKLKARTSTTSDRAADAVVAGL